MVFTERHIRALAVAPKPSAAISFFSCLYIVFSVALDPDRRRRLYHRLSLAMALNGLVYSAALFWGTWAIPSEMEERGYSHMAGGNWNTCQAQGFLIQYGFAVPCYYASLSLYSLLAVRNNFNQAKLARYEPWIHLTCIAVPLATAVVLQTKGMINPSGAWCWMARYPPGCVGGECERGENVRAYMWGLGYGLMFFNLGFATFMMGALYWTIQQRERTGKMSMRGKMEVLEKAKRARSRMVLHQAGQYLAAFYATYAVTIASRLVQTATGELNATLHVIAVAILPLQGFFYFLVYARLRVARSEDDGKMRVSIVPNSLHRISVRRLSLTKGLSEAILNMSRTTYRQSQWGLRASAIDSGNGNAGGNGAAAVTSAASDAGINSSGRNNRGSVMSRLSGSSHREFSIFDGTNCGADSIWARFLVDDYEEDEDEDEETGGAEFAQGGMGGGLKIPLEDKIPEVPSHEDEESDGSDGGTLPLSVPDALQSGNDTSGTSATTVESSGLFADSAQTTDSAVPRPSVCCGSRDDEMELVSEPERAREPVPSELSPAANCMGPDEAKRGSPASSKSLV